MTETGTKCCDGAFAKALEGASVQIELALRESHGPVEQLGETVRRLSKMLREHSRQVGSQDAGGSADSELAELRGCLATSIEKLQYHDRMVQHLTHVRDYLAAIANRLDVDDTYHATNAAPSAEDWEALRDRLRERLTSGAQRELFDLVLGESEGAEAQRPTQDDYAAQGSVELF